MQAMAKPSRNIPRPPEVPPTSLIERLSMGGSIALRAVAGEALTICRRRQAGDADSGVAFVADVHADEQRGDLLDDAGVFEWTAIDGADAGNLCCQFAGELRGVGIVAADDDVAVERSVAVEQFSGYVVEGGDEAHSFGHEFGSLLSGGALPDAESARGASADAGRERDRGVDEDAAVGHCRL